MELFGKNVLILGLGLSGRAATQFLQEKGAHVWAIDRNANLLKNTPPIIPLIEKGLIIWTEDHIVEYQKFDLCVVSPGIPATNIHYAQVRKQGLEVIGEIELAFRFINQPVIAITGTNGKTTTTLMIEHMLNESGLPAKALGNTGDPLTLELLKSSNNSKILVIELSSFQLDTLTTKCIDFAVILNISPDHLDRYITLEKYAESKFHIQDCMKSSGKLFVEEKCQREWGNLLHFKNSYSYGYSPESFVHSDFINIYVKEKIEYFLPHSYRNKPSHELENLMAGYAICREFGVSSVLFDKGLKSFSKPAHRIEFVRALKEINFVNDSKGTNLDAVIRAINFIDGQIVLIAGGVDKGASYTPWIKAFNDKVKCICTIGQAAKKIASDLGHAIPIYFFSTMSEAVEFAYKEASPGETVLLSPGCSSYDMYKDYIHRGEDFKNSVNNLI